MLELLAASGKALGKFYSEAGVNADKCGGG